MAWPIHLGEKVQQFQLLPPEERSIFKQLSAHDQANLLQRFVRWRPEDAADLVEEGRH